ncbi:MAG: GNAT family N-acetyltransferase [Glutamicibacter arilaitensis]|jgi:ElaA protein|uniref:GNAT family N-acetyltransferase n=1 Tax=Glutamicibacter arilaitensis TaxID=256701 RepID=A0A4Y8TRK9_9MICC|nr:GNAT family N-acetyltransferase [Glutamicibacter arilaitensis]TFH54497.1 GNAT family N-acetyltransferase [Glutamicibacter arilaitensis]
MTVSISIFKPAELPQQLFYAVLKLRADVFIVEQQSCYPDIDGHDLDEDTVHLCALEDGKVLCTVRIMEIGSPSPRIGRVATASSARGRGLAGELMKQAVGLCQPHAQIQLSAQTQLESWYGKFGFQRSGADYDDDGIMHLPMIRDGGKASL